ncbi:AMP-binding protein [Nocardioides ultimimeridianus]
MLEPTAVLARAGLLGPLSPAKLARAVLEVGRLGLSPATVVALSATRWPDRPAVIDDAGSLSYAELARQAVALAAQLRSSYDVGPDRGIAVMCRNHRGLVLGLLAAGNLGVDVLLVNTELPAQQLAATLTRHRPGVVLHDAEFDERLATADAGTPRHRVWGDDGPVEAPPYDGRLPRVRRAGRLVLLTSGTTGAPKGVPRSPHVSALMGVAVSAIERLDLRTGETMMVCPPAFHGMGVLCLMLGLALGDTVVLQRRFDAAAAAAAVERHRVDVMVAVPAMLQRLLALPDLERRTESLRVALSGAAPLSPVTAGRFAERVGEVVYDGYGSSEVGIVTLATPADLREAPGTLGLPTRGTRIAILDDGGRPLPVGQVGQIHVDSPMTFDGYTGGGRRDIRDGYLASGDMGRLDDRGRLFLEGRADDMIVSGGENVFPQPVETALLSHPDVADAAVIGVPDDDFGQRLRAFVVVTGAADRGRLDDELRTYLRARLTRYEVPRDIVVVDELPRNATGKVLRTQLATTPGGPA